MARTRVVWVSGGVKSRGGSRSRQLRVAPAKFMCVDVSPEVTESFISAALNFCTAHRTKRGCEDEREREALVQIMYGP